MPISISSCGQPSYTVIQDATMYIAVEKGFGTPSFNKSDKRVIKNKRLT